jgi:hypothetical protein
METANEQLVKELEEWFKTDELETLARETRFIQRSTSRLTGRELFNLLTVELLEEPQISYEGLCDRLEACNPNLRISPQALCERVNSDGAVNFLKACLEKTLKETSHNTLVVQESAWLRHFPRVLLQDSTQIHVHEKLTEAFKGSGGNAGIASIKLDYSYDVKNEKTEQIAIRQGIDNDQSFAQNLTDKIQEGDLVIRDLGYFYLNFFAHLATVGGYFLSRLKASVNIYLSVEATQPINLSHHLKGFDKRDNTLEFTGFLGQNQRLPVRLIAYRLPPAVYRERQQAAIKTAKRKGRTPNLSSLKLLKYSIFITNVPANWWHKDALGTIYRLRWQIELTFKHWKSLFHIHVLKGTRPERLHCLLYGRLIVILLVQRLLAHASRQAIHQQRELSFSKAIQWLMRNQRLLKAFLDRQLTELLKCMMSSLKRLLKQKRKRRTTWGLIEQQTPYLDSFAESKHFVCETLIHVGCT